MLKFEKNNGRFKNLLSIKNIIIYVLSLILSTISLGQSISPFSIAIVGSCLSSGVPTIIVTIMALIGNYIGIGLNSTIFLAIIIVVLLILMFIKPPKENGEYENERLKLSFHIFVSIILVIIAKLIFTRFEFIELGNGIVLAILAITLYKIFVNSIKVIQDYKRENIFSKEEYIGALLVLTICFTLFGNLSIYGISISKVLILLIVIMFGWKNNFVLSGCFGFFVAIIDGMILKTQPIYLAIYIFAGILGTILRKFGKIGVGINFILANILLFYFSKQPNCNLEIIGIFKEILIASLGLIFVNKSYFSENDDSNVMMLDEYDKRGLKNVDQTFEKEKKLENLANKYINENLYVLDESYLFNEKLFIAEVLNSLDGFEENFLYDDITNINNGIIKAIFKFLLKNEKIDKNELLKILENFNNYIVKYNNEKIDKIIDENIEQIIKFVNNSYNITKTNFKQMQKEEKKIVEKAIKKSEKVEYKNNMIQNNLGEEKHNFKLEISKVMKSKNEISNDSILEIRLSDSKHLIILSDGKDSEKLVELISENIINGFEYKKSISEINFIYNKFRENYDATLDILIIDLKDEKMTLIKNNACPTFIKNNQKIKLIKSSKSDKLVAGEKEFVDGDIIILCSDGVINSNVEYKNKESWVKYLIEDNETNDVNEITKLLINETIDNYSGIIKDDISVISCKLTKI